MIAEGGTGKARPDHHHDGVAGEGVDPMKKGKSLAIAALAALILAAGTAILAGEEGGPSPDEAAMMQKWMEFATPGEPHERLAERVGEWTFTTRMWSRPGAEPEASSGTRSPR